jgi:Protein of unknown function (DUF992)
MFRPFCLLATFVVGVAAAPDMAAAQARVSVGVLECRAGSSTGFIVGSVRDFDCLFTPTAGPLQRYGATIQRLGVDLGWSTSTVLVWSVFAPTEVVGPGALAGGYGGVSAGAAVGVGLGANALAGGLNNSFALQPVSVEGQTGLNAFAGVSSLELRQRY